MFNVYLHNLNFGCDRGGASTSNSSPSVSSISTAVAVIFVVVAVTVTVVAVVVVDAAVVVFAVAFVVRISSPSKGQHTFFNGLLHTKDRRLWNISCFWTEQHHEWKLPLLLALCMCGVLRRWVSLSW